MAAVHGLEVSVLSATEHKTFHLWEVQISTQQEAGINNS